MINKLYIMDTSALEDEALFCARYTGMPAERKKKIDFYRFGKDKRLSLGAGILLQTGLADCGLADAELVYNQNDKPLLRGRDDIFFNLSHSGTIAACAFSDRPVGVDVEERAHFEQEVVRRVYLPEEIARIAALEAPADPLYTDLWTIKESLMKYLGTGLTLDPKKIEVSFGDRITAKAEGYDCSALYFTAYATDGYSLTVCSEYEKFTDGITRITP